VTRRSRLRLGGPVPVPVVLPHVIVRPDGPGTVAVTLDGVSVSDSPIPRVQLGEAISQIVEQVAAAVRVEVHEPDGAVHADILSPPAHQPGQSAPPPDRPGQCGRPSHAKVFGVGSERGETTPIAAAITGATAPDDADMNLHVDLDPRLGRTGAARLLNPAASSGIGRGQEPA
jgi:hypothetical protein